MINSRHSLEPSIAGRPRDSRARSFWRALLLAGAILALPHAYGQAYPQKGISLVVPFPAGGITDVVSRIVAEELAKALGQTVLVDNKAGASGSIGLAHALAQPADGHTLVTGGNGPSAIVPALNPNARYAPSDFEPIAYIAGLPTVLVVHPSIPARTLQEFITYAKASGDKVACASHGQGSFNHLACVRFNKLTGTRMTHVPYKGAAPVMNDLLPGRVHAYFAPLPSVINAIKAGQLVPLATGSEERLAGTPNVPTLKEAGVAGLVVGSWNAVYVRAGTPQHIVRRLRDETEQILKRPDVVARIEITGSTFKFVPPEVVRAMTQSEYDLFRQVGRENNIQAE